VTRGRGRGRGKQLPLALDAWQREAMKRVKQRLAADGARSRKQFSPCAPARLPSPLLPPPQALRGGCGEPLR
jgi:hypothetical protein